MSTDLHIVVPAGGSGTRLWPLSRAASPKFLHPLTGTERSLLQATYDRLIPLVAPEFIHVVTGTAHAAAVARQLPEVPERNILVEPMPRDSCAAIALAAAVIAKDNPDAIMASFAADHVIADPSAFAETVLAAVEGAKAGQLMTIGITPTGPDTGFGYLRCSAPPKSGAAQPILEFKEKPSAEVAAEYFASGEYLWNASMFVWQVSAFLDALAEHRPDVLEPVQRIVAARDTDTEEQVLAEVWPTIPKVAVDYAVMEPAAAQGQVATVPGDFGWSDIGDFDTLGELLAKTCDGAAVVGEGEVICLDAENSIVVPQGGRLVALLGVRDLIVVDTPDALLVGRRDRTQDVKKLTELLKDRGLTGFL